MCKWGTTVQVRLCEPREISGRREVPVDSCIAPLVQALNDARIQTAASCCGHGKGPGNIVLADGRELYVWPSFEASRELDEVLPSLIARRRDLWPEKEEGES